MLTLEEREGPWWIPGILWTRSFWKNFLCDPPPFPTVNPFQQFPTFALSPHHFLRLGKFEWGSGSLTIWKKNILLEHSANRCHSEISNLLLSCFFKLWSELRMWKWKFAFSRQLGVEEFNKTRRQGGTANLVTWFFSPVRILQRAQHIKACKKGQLL